MSHPPAIAAADAPPARESRPIWGRAAAHLAFAGLSSRARHAATRLRVADLYASVFAHARFQEQLLATLKTGSADERWVAVVALAVRGEERAVPALVACLQDDDERVRVAAAESLGEIGGEVAGTALWSAWQDAGGAPAFRRALLHALWRAAHEERRNVAFHACAEGDVEAQLAALAALAQDPCLHCAPLARALLGAEDARVRALALALLERVGRPSDEVLVRPRLADECRRVRAWARDALAAIEHRSASAGGESHVHVQ